jgi:hypothetical protein
LPYQRIGFPSALLNTEKGLNGAVPRRTHYKAWAGCQPNKKPRQRKPPGLNANAIS